jgi:hypothetical protein
MPRSHLPHPVVTRQLALGDDDVGVLRILLQVRGQALRLDVPRSIRVALSACRRGSSGTTVSNDAAAWPVSITSPQSAVGVPPIMSLLDESPDWLSPVSTRATHFSRTPVLTMAVDIDDSGRQVTHTPRRRRARTCWLIAAGGSDMTCRRTLSNTFRSECITRSPEADAVRGCARWDGESASVDTHETSQYHTLTSPVIDEPWHARHLRT